MTSAQRRVALGVLGMAACQGRGTVAGSTGSEPPLPVEYAGCYSIRSGPSCGLTPTERTLSLWWAGEPATEVELSTDRGSLAPVTREQRAGGSRLVVNVPPGALWLQVGAAAGAGRPRLSFRLALRDVTVDPLVTRVIDLQAAGRADTALALIDQALPSLPTDRSGFAHRARARVSMATGQIDETIHSLRQSLRAFEQQGERLLAGHEAGALALMLFDQKQEYAEARQILLAAATAGAGIPEVLAPLRHLDGALALQLGDFRAALDATRDALEWSDRLGLEDSAGAARSQLAVVYKHLGRWREAADIQRARVAAKGADPCDTSDLLVDLALNLANRPGHGNSSAASAEAGEDPAELLARARASLGGCSDRERLRNILIEQALLRLDRSDVAGARAASGELARLPGKPSPRLALWQTELEARLALADGRFARAQWLFQSQQKRAAGLGMQEEALRALLGLGRALEAGGRAPAAVAAYRRAEASVDAQVSRLPLSEGVHGFSRTFRDGTAELVEALRRLDLPRAAMLAARRTNRRALLRAAQSHRVAHLSPGERRHWEEAIARYRRRRAQIEAEATDWTISGRERERRRRAAALREREIKQALDEAFRILGTERGSLGPALREPSDGEVLLTWFPVGGRWLGFAATQATTRSVPLGAAPLDLSAAGVAARFLTPFAAEIAAAKRLTMVAPDELWKVDWHAVPWRGQPLLAHVPIAYSADLGAAPAGCAPPSLAASALVVGDPTLDLRPARQEAGLVARALAVSGRFRVEQLTGRLASHARVLTVLDGASFFHYAGHGKGGSFEGLDSQLPLADGTALLAGDILSLGRAPARVVLTACEGARTPDDNPGLSLAHAFVAAGSESVLAASRNVPNDLAAGLVQALYERAGFDCDVSPAETARAAQLALMEQNADWDWSAFRVLIR